MKEPKEKLGGEDQAAAPLPTRLRVSAGRT